MCPEAITGSTWGQLGAWGCHHENGGPSYSWPMWPSPIHKDIFLTFAQTIRAASEFCLCTPQSLPHRINSEHHLAIHPELQLWRLCSISIPPQAHFTLIHTSPWPNLGSWDAQGMASQKAIAFLKQTVTDSAGIRSLPGFACGTHPMPRGAWDGPTC